MKDYIKIVLGLIIVVVLICNTSYQRTQIQLLEYTTTKQRALIDSISSELFIQHTIFDRYDIALEMLKEQNYEAAKQFEDCLSNVE